MDRREFLTGSASAIGLMSMSADSFAESNAVNDSSTPAPAGKIRVGLIQMKGKAFDKEHNLAQAEKWMRLAAARGAKLLCTPEAALQGYPRVSEEMCAPGVSHDDLRIVAERARILGVAETIPGPATDRIAALARELRVWIVFGMDENRAGKLFNTAVLMDPAGEIVGTYSKVHLQNWMLASGVNHGDGFPVWEVAIDGVKVKLGIEICYDIQHPESTLELLLGGAEVVLNPYCTDDFARPLLVHLYQTRALENRVYIARVNYAAPRSNGSSAIFDFEGATQDALGADEGVLVGDLDLAALREIRAASNPVYGPAYRFPRAYKRIGKI